MGPTPIRANKFCQFLPIADIVSCHMVFKLFSGVTVSVTISDNIGVIYGFSWTDAG